MLNSWHREFCFLITETFLKSLQVTASQLSVPSNRYSVPILADSENDKCEWVGVLSDLHKRLRKSHSRDRSVYVLKEAYGSSLPLIQTTHTAAIIGMGSNTYAVGPYASPQTPDPELKNVTLSTTRLSAQPA